MKERELLIDKDDCILIIAPHPDDESIGVGGLIAMYPKQCNIIVLTDGCKGNARVQPRDEKIIRRNQFVNGMSFAGVTAYSMIELEDGTLMKNAEKIKHIPFDKYNKIFLPNVNDNHPDHAAATMFSLEIIQTYMDNKVEVYLYEVHTPFKDITHYLDISDVIEKKQRMVSFHEDQLYEVKYVEGVAALAKYRSCRIGEAEGYKEGYVQVFLDNLESLREEYAREQEVYKQKQQKLLLIKWLTNNQQKKLIWEKVLSRYGKKVSIYGCADLGRLLYQELSSSGLIVCNLFDARHINIDGNRETIPICEGNNEEDCVIITVCGDTSEIKRELQRFGHNNLVSIQELIMEE